MSLSLLPSGFNIVDDLLFFQFTIPLVRETSWFMVKQQHINCKTLSYRFPDLFTVRVTIVTVGEHTVTRVITNKGGLGGSPIPQNCICSTTTPTPTPKVS